MIQEYIDRVELAIQTAQETQEDKSTKLSPEVFQLPGMSSREGRILLNELVKDNDKYLEVGIHKGSTFVSAMYKNNAKAVAIDNFSQFGGQEVKNWFDQACNDHNIKNFDFINNDCFNLTDDEKLLIKDINVYFYDGDHKEDDQEKALTYYIDLMSKVFIFIVDDWNHAPARTGTKLGLEKTNVKVHKEWILDTQHTGKGWHNGLYVAVLEKP